MASGSLWTSWLSMKTTMVVQKTASRHLEKPWRQGRYAVTGSGQNLYLLVEYCLRWTLSTSPWMLVPRIITRNQRTWPLSRAPRLQGDLFRRAGGRTLSQSCAGVKRWLNFNHMSCQLCFSYKLVDVRFDMMYLMQARIEEFVHKVRLMQCSQFFRRAHFCKKTGAFWTKIRALDGRKDGQNSGFSDFVVFLWFSACWKRCWPVCQTAQ